MRSIAPPLALACVALLALRSAAAPDAEADATRARVVIAAAGAESPAAAFDRMLAPRSPTPAPRATGTQADALTHAFNLTLWSATPARQTSVRSDHTGRAQ